MKNTFFLVTCSTTDSSSNDRFLPTWPPFFPRHSQHIHSNSCAFTSVFGLLSSAVAFPCIPYDLAESKFSKSNLKSSSGIGNTLLTWFKFVLNDKLQHLLEHSTNNLEYCFLVLQESIAFGLTYGQSCCLPLGCTVLFCQVLHLYQLQLPLFEYLLRYYWLQLLCPTDHFLRIPAYIACIHLLPCYTTHFHLAACGTDLDGASMCIDLSMQYFLIGVQLNFVFLQQRYEVAFPYLILLLAFCLLALHNWVQNLLRDFLTQILLLSVWACNIPCPSIWFSKNMNEIVDLFLRIFPATSSASTIPFWNLFPICWSNISA